MKYLIPLSVFLLCCLPQLRAEISVSLVDSVSCVCEGNPQQAFEVVATGSVGPFTFEWAGPDGYTSTEKEPSDITEAGSYELTVYNAYSCSFSYEVEHPACEPPQLNIVPNSCLGELTLEIEGGTSPFTILKYLAKALVTCPPSKIS